MTASKFTLRLTTQQDEVLTALQKKAGERRDGKAPSKNELLGEMIFHFGFFAGLPAEMLPAEFTEKRKETSHVGEN
jgi:hypothetical protein